MLDQIKKRFRHQYQTLNRIEISHSALISNYQYLSSLSKDLKIAPVLKSNAYGHGIVLTAQILDSKGAPFFCVDSLYEAYELYKTKIKTPILIMGYTDPENFKVKKLPFSYAVWDLKTLEVLNKYQKGAGIHLKIDTGMHRLGIPISELPLFIKQLKQFPNLRVEGLMSHLASAQNIHNPIFQLQLDNFKKAQYILHQAGTSPQWIHLGASEAILNPEIRKEIAQISNLGRAGLALYGISPSKTDSKLKPVLQLTSKIVQIKELQRGEKVGYDGIFTAPKNMIIGVLPIGYFDGVDRRLSNIGSVVVGGVECKILGRVSMNITTVDLTQIKNPKLGQEVTVYSSDSQNKNSIKESAKVCQTIPYDLLIHLAPSTKRVVTS